MFYKIILLFLCLITASNSSNPATGVSVKYGLQPIPTNTPTTLVNPGSYALTFNQVLSPNWNGTSGVYTSNITGFYSVSVGTLWANYNPPLGNRRLDVFLNGGVTPILSDYRDTTTVTGGPWTNWISMLLYLNAGDKISFMGSQTQGNIQYVVLTIGIILV